MILSVLRYISLSVQLAALLYVFVCALRSVRQTAAALPAFYLALSAASLLLSDVYWLAHLLLLSGDRILPYAANDISESGMFLLLGAALRTAVPGRPSRPAATAAGALVYSAVCAGLWIGWSGEWIKDIVGAIPFGYCVFMTLRALDVSGALSQRAWRVLIAATAVLLGGEIVCFFLPTAAAAAVDTLCYVLMFAVLGWLFRTHAAARRSGVGVKAQLALAALANIWSISSMYMCTEPAYFAAEMGAVAAFLLMLRAVKRMVDEA